MAVVDDAPAVRSLLDIVRNIEATIRDHAAEAENDRRLSGAVVDIMRAHGLYGLWRPKSLGGLEVDPMTAFRVFEELSRIDSAAGWNLQLSCGADAFGAWFPDEGAREVFSGDAILVGSFFPTRRAVAADGGYRVTGRTAFVSGVHHGTWIIGLANVFDGDSPRLWESGEPVTIMTVCPAHETEIVDNWQTLGMRGTGSHDVVMQDVFVPERRTAALIPLQKPGSAYGGPLYRFSLWATISALATVSTGIARAAIDDLLELAAQKSPSYTTKVLKDRSIVQWQLGRAEAILGAARAYLYQSLQERRDVAVAGR